MNGKTAREIRRYAFVRWQGLSPKDKNKMPLRGINQMFKKIYYQQNRSFKGLIAKTIG